VVDQDERSNLVIDCLDTLLIEMGEAQLDHIAIPQLVVVPADLLVAESRKGASEAVGAMLVGRIIADHPQPLVKRIIRERLIIRARENVTPIAGHLLDGFEDFQRLLRRRFAAERPCLASSNTQSPSGRRTIQPRFSGHASATERDSVT
jgi:hypothetical protein